MFREKEVRKTPYPISLQHAAEAVFGQSVKQTLNASCAKIEKKTENRTQN